MAFLPSSQDCSKSAMNSNLRKKFTSPFSVKKYPYSRATAAKLSPTNSKWKADQSTKPLCTPSLQSNMQAPKRDYRRMQGKDDVQSKEISDSMVKGKTPKQLLARSLFGAKLTSVKEKSYPEEQNHYVNNSFSREEGPYNKEMELHGQIMHSQLKQSMMELHGRMQENDDMESKQVSDSMMSRKILQQNLTKSSFGAKSTSVKENSYPQKQNRQVNSIFLREKWLDDKEMHLCGHITHPQLVRKKFTCSTDMF